MRIHMITAALLAAPWAIGAAQDTTKQKDRYPQSQDTTMRQARDARNQEPQSDQAVLTKLHRNNEREIRLSQLAQRNASSPRVKQFAAQLVRDHQAADQKVLQVAQRMGVTSLTRGHVMDTTAGQFGRRDPMQRRDTTLRGNDTTGRQGWPQRDTTQRRDTTGREGFPQRSDTTGREGFPQRSDTTGREGFPQRSDTTGRQGFPPRTDTTAMHGQDSLSEMRQQEDVEKKLSTLQGAAFDSAFAQAMVKGHDKTIAWLERVQTQVQNPELRTLITSTLPTVREHRRLAATLPGATQRTTSSSY